MHLAKPPAGALLNLLSLYIELIIVHLILKFKQRNFLADFYKASRLR